MRDRSDETVIEWVDAKPLGTVTVQPETSPPPAGPLVEQPASGVSVNFLTEAETQAFHQRALSRSTPISPPKRIVTRAELEIEDFGPQLPDFIEQKGGRSFSRAATRELISGGRLSGEAAELRAYIFGNEASDGFNHRLSGMQSAAFVATGDGALVGKVRRLIHFRGADGFGAQLHDQHVIDALRHEIWQHHCGCGAFEGGLPPHLCDCFDHALGELNQAIRTGKIFELSEQSRDPLNLENA